MEQENLHTQSQRETELVKEVMNDYEERRQKRLNEERNWQLYIMFAEGKQYMRIHSSGEIEAVDKDYYWQKQEVYNHIAPLIETRIAKLANVNTSISVRPATSDTADIETAKFSTKILKSVWQSAEIKDAITQATKWSELTGTAFYKIGYDVKKGFCLATDANGKKTYSGDVTVTVCSPFEIYPDDLTATDVDDVASIIHAKAVNVDDVEKAYGVKVNPSKTIATDFGNLNNGFIGQNDEIQCDNCAILIERYTRPTVDKPRGELIVVCADKLLYMGDLPYVADGEPSLPFVRQVCMEKVNSFFGATIIQRLIPIQRAYNALKNKKHEMFNRIAMGVIAVEDGSVDVDELIDEGLTPGKILVYRQGSNPPSLLNLGKIPTDIEREEMNLINEFTMVSGVSDLMQYTSLPQNMTSGIAISLLIEQDDTRLIITANSLRHAVRNLGIKILEVIKSTAHTARIMKIAGDNGEVEAKYFSASQITSDDVVLDTESDVIDSPSSRKNMVYELLKLGVLSDSEGKMSESARLKVLETLGMGNWESALDISRLQQKRALSENIELKSHDIECDEIDDDEIHIAEHTKFALSISRDRITSDRINKHIALHKAKMKFNKIEEAL